MLGAKHISNPDFGAILKKGRAMFIGHPLPCCGATPSLRTPTGTDAAAMPPRDRGLGVGTPAYTN